MASARLAACLLLLAASSRAQQADGDWLASAAAREFRMRVAELAVIHGDSRGIDPRGLLVTGRRTGDGDAPCAEVDIAVLGPAQQVLLHESLRACRPGR